MACFHPISAFQTESGEIVFVERGRIRRPLFLPCGQCIGCRLERSRQWAVRCMHEAQLHDSNIFVTLTYNDDNLPTDLSLNYRHYQLFMKRLRKDFAGRNVRFYMCGEYGEDFQRPHFHACLFNCFFTDRKLYSNLASGAKLYTSERLSELWPYGFSSIGDVTFESAAYVARYCMKKVTGPAAVAHYERVNYATGEVCSVEPEFTRMSLKPGIGADWFKRYRSDVFGSKKEFGDDASGVRDYVIVRGMKMKPPRYYDNMLKSAEDFSSDYVEFLRQQKAASLGDENTPERLAVREKCVEASLQRKVRVLK